MKVSGFTFLRNASLLGYPFAQSILSVLPICDEFIVAAGAGEDDTLERLQRIDSPKLHIVETTWNEKIVERGYVYAQQKMIAQFNCTGDWAFYLEGDEVLHEQDLPAIRASMERYLEDRQVEALVFDYYHFFGSPAWLADSSGYRRAVRIIRNTIRNYSPDGLFFVVMDKNKRRRYPRAALAHAHIYHYGHVRNVDRMREKIQRVSRYWGQTASEFKGYAIDPHVLHPFTGTHPAVMCEWLKREANWDFLPDPNHVPTRRDRRKRGKLLIEQWFGVDLSRKHYRLV